MHFRFKPRRNPGSQSQHRSVNRTAVLAAQVEVYADPPVSILRGGVSYPRRAMGSAADVRGLLGVPTLEDMGFDGHGVAVAIVDTGINLGHLRDRGVAASLDATVFWKPPTSAEPGHFPVGHGTMCAYDALVCAPRATLLDFPVLQSQRRGGSVMDGLLSDAILAYGVLLTELSKPLAQRAYRALVVSNSWGMYNPSWDFAPGRPGRYGDNPGHPFNRQVASLARAGADIIFAAGNCGSDCPDGRCRDDQGTVHTHVISGANSHPNVLSVAGVDVNEDRVCYSSQGPGMLNNDRLQARYQRIHSLPRIGGKWPIRAGHGNFRRLSRGRRRRCQLAHAYWPECDAAVGIAGRGATECRPSGWRARMVRRLRPWYHSSD